MTLEQDSALALTDMPYQAYCFFCQSCFICELGSLVLRASWGQGKLISFGPILRYALSDMS